jgi:hypothetical protein
VSDLWYPEATRKAAPVDGGSWTGGGRKGLLHTTEVKTASQTLASYRETNFWPHFTAAFERNRFQIWQHIPLDRAGRALGKVAGGVQTNRAHVIQIELVGTADKGLAQTWDAPDLYVERWSDEYLAGIAAWMRWVEESFAVPRRSTVRFLRYPESFGASNPNRLSAPDWTSYAGWLGHQHVPQQVHGHGDPGLIDIDALLTGPEDISIADDRTKAYLDDKFQKIGDRLEGRVDRALQRVGGKTNSVYSDNDPDFRGLVMAEEALAEAKAAKEAAQRITAGLDRVKGHLGIR